MKKLIAVLAVLIFSAAGLHAAVLFEKAAALKEVFPDAGKIIEKTITISAEAAVKINASLDTSAAVKEGAVYTLYNGVKAGKDMGTAVFESAKGKWGPVEELVLIDSKELKILNIVVTASSEQRGKPVTTKNFLNQFAGKGKADAITVKKDITAISGATISSRAVATGAKRALLVVAESSMDTGKGNKNRKMEKNMKRQGQ